LYTHKVAFAVFSAFSATATATTFAATTAATTFTTFTATAAAVTAATVTVVSQQVAIARQMQISEKRRRHQESPKYLKLFSLKLRAGSVCLNSFPGFISGVSAGFRRPREAAAG
jgi:hypothetical protein